MAAQAGIVAAAEGVAEVASDSEMAAEGAAEMAAEMAAEGAVKSPQGFRPNPKVTHEMDYQMPLVHFHASPLGGPLSRHARMFTSVGGVQQFFERHASALPASLIALSTVVLDTLMDRATADTDDPADSTLLA